MAKGNQFKKSDLILMNQHFDTVKQTLEDIADAAEPVMPLVSDSLRFTIKLVKLYKESFNRGLE